MAITATQKSGRNLPTKRRSVTPEQEREIARLAMMGFSASRIKDELVRVGTLKPSDVSDRNLRRMVRDFASADTSEYWSLAAHKGDAAEGQLLLGVAFRIASESRGHGYLTKDLAAWVVRIWTACPGISLGLIVEISRAYQVMHHLGHDTRLLDLLLGSRYLTERDDDSWLGLQRLYGDVKDGAPALPPPMPGIFLDFDDDVPIADREDQSFMYLLLPVANDFGAPDKGDEKAFTVNPRSDEVSAEEGVREIGTMFISPRMARDAAERRERTMRERAAVATADDQRESVD